MERMRIFLDTDIGPDCDDAGALAVLLQLCREGHAELIGATHCTGSPYGLAAIDSICRLFGVRVPVGTCEDRTFLTNKAQKFTPSLAAAFEHSYPADGAQPDAVEALTEALSAAPDGSVTMIGIGPMSNMGRFVNDPEVLSLMERKVCRIVLMAGTFVGGGAEWNVEMHIPGMRAVAEKWRGRLELSPFETFGDVLTGAKLVTEPDNPVAMAYRIFTEGGMLRPSWDPGTVACTILGPGPGLRWSENGSLTVDGQGRTRFTPDPHGNCRVLLRDGRPEPAAEWIEDIMGRAAETMAEALRG